VDGLDGLLVTRAELESPSLRRATRHVRGRRHEATCMNEEILLEAGALVVVAAMRSTW